MKTIQKDETALVGGGLESAFITIPLTVLALASIGGGFVDGLRDGLNGSTDGTNRACPATTSIN